MLVLSGLIFYTSTPLKSYAAGIAQVVEQRIRNAWVRGSSPLSGTILYTSLSKFVSEYFLIESEILTGNYQIINKYNKNKY